MFALRARLRRTLAVFASASFLLATFSALLGSAQPAFAQSLYGTGDVGYDISYPNCSTTIQAKASNGSSYSFAVVGVTGGKAFTQNSCLATEFSNAAVSTKSLYMNLNYPVGTTASNGDTGPAGKCTRADKSCQAYNYGWNAAQNADQYASYQNAQASIWWLDIETGNSWSPKTTLNAQV